MIDLYALAIAALLHVSPWLAVDEVRLAETAIPIAAVSSEPRDVFDLVAVGWFESGGTWDQSLIGDSGHSRSVFALWVCPGEHCLPVIIDPEYAARLALLRLRLSERDCSALKGGNVWSSYTTGQCIRNREARLRWRLARRLEREIQIEPIDDEVNEI